MGSSAAKQGSRRKGLEGRVTRIPLIGPLLRFRFTRFGAVGLAGTGVNLVMLYVHQEWVFQWVGPPATRLRLSLAAAIFLATLHNFLWNRVWTWRERRRTSRSGFFVQMAQYFLACGLAIGLQYLLTLLLARTVHYLIANGAAIALAAVVSFLVNDLWTFARQRMERGA